MPTCAGRRPPCSACAARPCPSSRWCEATTASAGSVLAGRVLAGRVPEERGAPRLVERRPVLHAVAETELRDRGVVGEAVRRVAVAPAAVVLERLRQVPVVEGGVGRDAALEHAVDEAVVEVEAGVVDLAAAGRHDPRPGDGEAVGRHPERRDEVEVGLPPVVVVARDRAVGGVEDRARLRAEGVPDGDAAPVLGVRALDLEGGGRDAPDEAVGERAGSRGLGCGRHVVVPLCGCSPGGARVHAPGSGLVEDPTTKGGSGLPRTRPAPGARHRREWAVDLAQPAGTTSQSRGGRSRAFHRPSRPPWWVLRVGALPQRAARVRGCQRAERSFSRGCAQSQEPAARRVTSQRWCSMSWRK